VVLQHLNSPDRAERMAALVEVYRNKRDAFAKALQENFADLATWQTPSGGLFFWLQLKRRVDTRTLLSTAIEHGVAFMPGEAFYASDKPAPGSMRLNFSHASSEQIHHGLRTLAELVRTAR
jgi:2-aminoadipate transaminase